MIEAKRVVCVARVRTAGQAMRVVSCGQRVSVCAAIALLLAGAGCTKAKGPPAVPSIGEAFVGPVALKIRSDPSPQSAVVTTVKHGERLSILGRRRRILRVRAPDGAEGWTDERQLLSAEEMAGLRELAARAKAMPSQGQATTFGELNIHSLPARAAPSFLQIKEGEKVDVLAHVNVPRAEPVRKPLIPPAEKKAKAASRKTSKKEPKIPPLPMPKPPPPPENWVELSKTDLEEAAEAPEPGPPEKPVPTEDWSLVRASSGPAGWVLTRLLTMAIPDEVAQYAEGRRIVSYFSLGAVDDGGEKKNTWLWTTMGGKGQAYDFDSFRVFVWGLRKHRYETAYIERNLKGYSPVLLHDVEYATGKQPGFSICVEKKDGPRMRREYAVMGNMVRLAGDRPCDVPPSPMTTLTATPPVTSAAPDSPGPARASLAERIKRRVKGWFGK